MATAKFILWVFSAVGTAGFAALGIVSGLFPKIQQKIRDQGAAIMDTPGPRRNWFLASCYFVLAIYFGSAAFVYFHNVNTPVRDNAMRLVSGLNEFLNQATTNKMSSENVMERFGKYNYDQWVVKVHSELFEHGHHLDRLDDMAQKLATVGVYNTFENAYNNKPATNTISEIRDDIDSLAKPLKE